MPPGTDPPVFDEPVDRRLCRAAVSQDRCADLLNCLEAGGAATIDGRGNLVCIDAATVAALAGD